MGSGSFYGLSRDELALVLAAALHDVGKIPVTYDYRSGGHPLLGGKLVSPLADALGDTGRRIRAIIENHHNQGYKDDFREFINLADHIVSSMERADRADKEDEIEARERRSTPLLSVSSILYDVEKYHYYCRLRDLVESVSPLVEGSRERVSGSPGSIDVRVFPTTREAVLGGSRSLLDRGRQGRDLAEVAKRITESLERDLSLLSVEHPFFLDHLDSVLLDHTIFVPSAVYYSYPTASLYFHLKGVAAFSLVFYKNWAHDGRKDKKSSQRVLLVKGDFSGIQRFIFGVHKREESQEKMAKRVRGRSFLVYLLGDAIARTIVSRLGLSPFNILSREGGNFLVAVQDTPEARSVLRRIMEEANKFLFKKYGGSIRLALGWSVADFSSETDARDATSVFYDALKRLAISIAISKASLPLPEVEGSLGCGEREVCPVCGLRKKEENERVCGVCASIERLGGELPKAACIVLSPGEEDGTLLTPFGLRYVPAREYEDSKDCLNIFVNNPALASGSGALLLVGNYTPKKDGSIISFEGMVSLGGHESRTAPLAILKTDGDRMGVHFSRLLSGRVSDGEKDGDAGISEKYIKGIDKFLFFSFWTSLFYSVVINRIAREYQGYVAYSGGDDTTIIARLDNSCVIADTLRDFYTKWMGSPNFTVSAGMVIGKHNMPFDHLVSRQGEQSLKQMKDSGRDGISIFGIPVKWQYYHQVVREFLPFLYRVTRTLESKGGA